MNASLSLFGLLGVIDLIDFVFVSFIANTKSATSSVDSSWSMTISFCSQVEPYRCKCLTLKRGIVQWLTGFPKKRSGK
jgi:hypothetical protein